MFPEIPKHPEFKDIKPFTGGNRFDEIENKIVMLNAMILAAVSLMEQHQIDAFEQAYADKLSRLQLSIASYNQED